MKLQRTAINKKTSIKVSFLIVFFCLIFNTTFVYSQPQENAASKLFDELALIVKSTLDSRKSDIEQTEDYTDDKTKSELDDLYKSYDDYFNKNSNDIPQEQKSLWQDMKLKMQELMNRNNSNNIDYSKYGSGTYDGVDNSSAEGWNLQNDSFFDSNLKTGEATEENYDQGNTNTENNQPQEDTSQKNKPNDGDFFLDNGN